jgi:hypothetical protein
MAVLNITSTVYNFKKNDTSTYSGKAIYQDDKITYQDEDARYEVKVLGDHVVFKKKRKDGISFLFYFELGKTTDVLVEENNMSLSIPLYTEKLNLEENKIEVYYTLNDSENFKFCFEYESR